MDRYEVMAGKMTPLTDGAHRKWGFTGKVETRSYERLVDALIDFVETGDGLKARFITGFAACLAADRKSVENRGFGVAVRKVQCHRGEDGTVRVSSVETMHERRYTVDDWRYDTAHIAKRDETFYFVDDEYNPFVRHAPVKTTEAVFRFFANGYRREHGTEPEVTGNRKLSERDILSGMRQMLYDLSNE